MTFTDLPANWPDLPLTDPALAADVVDLFVSQGDRRRGVLSALLCNAEARFLAAIHLDLPENAPFISPKACAKALAPLIPALRIRSDGALILALGRPTPDPSSDHAWNQTAIQTCQSASIRLLGFYIATPGHLYAPPLSASPTLTPA
ncbi:hypothetical protein [Streptomyces sp. SID13031]|uniref:hypothetical protein n=1 Tax=Streptomyces sp. SID13031 TaxID=2706046 RepID=UPI0013C71CA9|nr:hypothetical protein [Streptomyces sp. SID13031]NEA30428.1 hypothetical protein [Streptomyces sp. SID13031]